MNKTVLITGANRGLGLALIEVFHAGGWTVFPLGRNAEALNKLKSRFPKNCHPICSDVSKNSVRDDIEKGLSNHTQSLDLLINNAGIPGVGHSIETLNPDEILDLFDVHCLGAVRCTQGALGFLLKSGMPTVVNVTSRLGSLSKTSSGDFAHLEISYAYRVAKAAQNMFSACLNQELKKKGVRVFSIHPGRLTTDTHAADADTPASIGAQKVFDWLKTSDRNQSGTFFEPFSEEFPW